MSSAIAHSLEPGGFEDLPLDRALQKALAAAGFREPRPIQAETLPAALEGRDVLGLAQTGTGKTAAFALPLIQRAHAERRRGTRALILAPTRELASQIERELRLLSRFTKVSVVSLYGGVPVSKNVRQLKRRPDIVVGCPGRVLDLMQQGVFDPRSIEALVLDEADHMFDLGFLPDLKRILKGLPRDRQNLLFSATMPREIRKLANQVLEQPQVIELAPSAPSQHVEHFLYRVPETGKRDLLDQVLAGDDCATAIVFTRTKHRAKRTAQRLAELGLKAVALQGNMSQGQRQRAMSGFREGKFDVLVATDIAARGIDVAGIDYVVNFDVPDTSDAYTHRIGRTGRSETSGKACTFVTPADRRWLRDTERALGSSIPVRGVVGGAEEAEPEERGRGKRSGRPHANRGRHSKPGRAKSSRPKSTGSKPNRARRPGANGAGLSEASGSGRSGTQGAGRSEANESRRTDPKRAGGPKPKRARKPRPAARRRSKPRSVSR
ncbi:MAG: DEAD/DEAH box helicase [Myxococcota bacterium]